MIQIYEYNHININFSYYDSHIKNIKIITIVIKITYKNITIVICLVLKNMCLFLIKSLNNMIILIRIIIH